MISFYVEEQESVDASVTETNNVLDASITETVGAGTTDYNLLKNKPTLDGVEIIGAMYEKDPTVPTWAKANSKPSYTSEEVGAVDENSTISLVDLQNLWNKFFE